MVSGSGSRFGVLVGAWQAQERLEFAPDGLQGFVVLQQSVVDFGQAFKDVGVSGNLLTHLDELRTM